MVAGSTFSFAPPPPSLCSHFAYSRLVLVASPKPFSIRVWSCPILSSSEPSILALNKGVWDLKAPESMAEPQRRSVVCMALPPMGKKRRAAVKKARQAERTSIFHKARKMEVRTRMKKVFDELDLLKKKAEAQAEELLPIDKLITEAESAIDKAVKVGSMHHKTAIRRKFRLKRRKRIVEYHHGWYVRPPPATAPPEDIDAPKLFRRRSRRL